jgi:ribosome-binding factor A
MAVQKKSRFVLPAGLRPEPKRRPARVGDLLRNEIATLLLYKIKDPRVAAVTVTQVIMSDDLSRAKVYYSCDEKLLAKARKGLTSAGGFIRSYLARTLNMRYVPQLIFKHDPEQAQREKLDQLFQEIAAENERSTERDS